MHLSLARSEGGAALVVHRHGNRRRFCAVGREERSLQQPAGNTIRMDLVVEVRDGECKPHYTIKKGILVM